MNVNTSRKETPCKVRRNHIAARAVRRIATFVGISLPVSTLVLTAQAQNSAQPQYQGFQPELVQGIQEGFADTKPKIRHIYLAAPDTLGVTVDAQHLWSDPVQPYVPQPGDVIVRERPQPYGTQGHQFFWGRAIIRNGVRIGEVAGPKEDHYIPLFRLRGDALDVAWAEKPGSYELTSGDDVSYRTARAPLAVFRKSKPEIYEWTDKGKQEASVHHELFLKLPHPLTPGKHYRLNFGTSGPFTAPVSFLFDDTRLRTEAIEVNQVGYHTRQTEKVARLFEWLGSGGGVDFSAFKNFLVVDNKTGKTVFRGDIKVCASGDPSYKMPSEGNPDTTDTLPAPIYQLEFSAFSQSGVYRIVVPGLGTSFPFRIDENIWVDAAKVSATGFLNQRSGIELGPPYTTYKRPRNFHPADGVPIYKTSPELFFDPARFDNKKYAGNSFARIQASILEGQTEPNAWGGWHDAADYDRDVLPQNHPRAVQAMLDLYESNPAYFEKLNLNLPESKNAIPDIIDEALWCMDLFLRIQQPDGAIPSAVEEIEHPSEPSWLLKQPTVVTPSTPQTCMVYAAAAAQMSLDLARYDAARARAYRESAIRAMQWAANNSQVPNIFNFPGLTPVTEHANLAAAWMYRLTGDPKWHNAFKRTLKVLYPSGKIRLESGSSYEGPWGLAAYALMPANQADVDLQKQCRAAILSVADDKIAESGGWPYALKPRRFKVGERLGMSWDLIAAHRLTQDSKYLRLMERTAQFAMGLNPSNASYTSGLGSRQVVPYHFDARYLGVPYPDGISTQGPAPRNTWGGRSAEKSLAAGGLFPAWENWPWAESNFNVRISPLNEHTVEGNMANILMTRAYLAQAMSGSGGAHQQ